ncbi:hypothetical protein [Megamonas funiformis]|uniref:hypothetical protein n=1 Tax=Megamonas funiformis TaxID=437897 RepID=UPI002675F879|nr:hypothetical protein [Megamonas funiformis]
MFGERFRRKMRDSIQFSKRLKGEPIVEAENLKQEIMSNKKIKIDKILIKYNKKIKASNEMCHGSIYIKYRNMILSELLDTYLKIKKVDDLYLSFHINYEDLKKLTYKDIVKYTNLESQNYLISHDIDEIEDVLQKLFLKMYNTNLDNVLKR